MRRFARRPRLREGFWDDIDRQLKKLEKAKSADDVIRILGGASNASAGDAFFAGSGGDGSVEHALSRAGWKTVAYKAPYYWAMKSPRGDFITYVEGDVYRGLTQGLGESRRRRRSRGRRLRESAAAVRSYVRAPLTSAEEDFLGEVVTYAENDRQVYQAKGDRRKMRRAMQDIVDQVITQRRLEWQHLWQDHEDAIIDGIARDFGD